MIIPVIVILIALIIGMMIAAHKTAYPKKLEDTFLDQKFLERLPKVYSIHLSPTQYEIREHTFAGSYTGKHLPFVYHPSNSTAAPVVFIKTSLDLTTDSPIVMWTFDKDRARTVLDSLNRKESQTVERSI